MDVNTCYATTEAYRELALYSHLIPAIATIVLGVFALMRAQRRFTGAIFFSFTAVFALWLFADLINWTANDYNIVAATWAPLDFLNIVFFLLLGTFVFADFYDGKIPRWYVFLVAAAASVPFVITLAGQAVYELHQPVCEMAGNEFLARYKLAIEGLVLLGIIMLAVRRIMSAWSDRTELVRVLLITGSIVLFMGVFAGAERISTMTGVYEMTLYSLFPLPIFILLLTMAITSYGTFRLGDAAVKALFYVFLILGATQFFFVQDIVELMLAVMGFGVIVTLGIMLFRLSEREIAQRHLIEKQEQELEVANKQQENLLHFISHEIKGYLTNGEAGFASIAEGDYGAISPQLKTMAESALANTRKGVATIMDILKASDMKKGTVAYKKASFDFRTAVEGVINEQRSAAYEKHLGLEVNIAEGKYTMEGDEEKLRENVIRNLIDNAIRYTPAGTVYIELSDGDGKIHFSVKDSGVGITPEDMARLFTEGGHGKDSIKTNVHSTGYGLFIAKQVVDAHGGKIWAESEGNGKGSRFVVELPAALS